MTIGKLKGLFFRLYKVDSADQKLSYVDSKVCIQRQKLATCSSQGKIKDLQVNFQIGF